MSKIAYIGVGSAVFAKRLMGDCMLMPALQDFELAIHDIDLERLKDAEKMLNTMKETLGSSVRVKAYADRREALRGAKYVVNSVLVGGYDHVRIDMEVPKKYGLRQTIADTLGIGGIFRGLRTIPVLQQFAEDIHELCPGAFFINYTNPMSILTNVMNTRFGVETVGLCHSVQSCVPKLFDSLDMDPAGVKWKIAGINHMAWLLEISRDGVDLYPEIKRRAQELQENPHDNMVRFDVMFRFGYYVTESSNHHSEYYPYYLKRNYPELAEKYNIELDRVYKNMERKTNGRAQTKQLVNAKTIEHVKSKEYGSNIIEAMETNKLFKFAGNVMNTGLITNLPKEACVEVTCMVDSNGIQPTYVGDLPPVCAAVNRNQINPQLLTVEAAVSLKKEQIYHAAFLDPHTAAELSQDDIVALCDDLIEAHGDLLPKYK
jgi:alpha-galactosidase